MLGKSVNKEQKSAKQLFYLERKLGAIAGKGIKQNHKILYVPNFKNAAASPIDRQLGQ